MLARRQFTVTRSLLIEQIERRMLMSASPIALDPSYGSDGVAITQQPAAGANVPVFSAGTAVVELPNGQSLVAGALTVGDASGSYIRRFNGDGSLDNSFAPGQGFQGQDGYVFVTSSTVAGLSVDPAGNIYLGESGTGIARFTSSGQLDTSFGTSAVAQANLLGPFLREGNGQILLNTGTSMVTQLNADGSVDISFGTTGTVTVPTAFSVADGAFAIQSDGDILVGGSTPGPVVQIPALGSTHADLLAVLRLTPAGAVDSAFGTSGIASAGALPEEVVSYGIDYGASATSLSVLPSGLIVAGGTARQDIKFGAIRDGMTVAEFSPSGQLNPAFGIGGQTPAYVPDVNNAYILSQLVVQNDGTMVAVGTELQDISMGPGFFEPQNVFVTRYTADGLVDSTATSSIIPVLFNSADQQEAAVSNDGTSLVALGASGADSLPASARFIIDSPRIASGLSITTLTPSIGSGAAATFQATLIPASQGSATPSGSVTFYMAGKTTDTQTPEFYEIPIGSAELQSDGTAQFVDSTLPDGTLSIIAQCIGDAIYAPADSSAILELVDSIPGVATTTTLSSSNPSVNSEHAVRFTAQVTSNGSQDAVSTGSVTFMQNGYFLGNANFDGPGTATLVTQLPAGSYGITAVYSGDSEFAASTSSVVQETATTPSILPTITRSTIPISLVAGFASRGTISFTLADQTSGNLKEKIRLELFASTDGAIDDSVIELAHSAPKVNLKTTGASRESLTVQISKSERPAGSYTLLLRAVDSSGENNDSLIGPTLVVAAPTISLSETFVKMTLPSAVNAGARSDASAVLLITNNGNITPGGKTTVALYATQNGVIDSNAIQITSVKIPLRPGPQKSSRVSLSIRKIPQLAAGAYTIIAEAVDPDQQITTVAWGTNITVTG